MDSIILQCGKCKSTKLISKDYFLGELWCNKCVCSIKNKMLSDMARKIYNVGFQEGKIANQKAMKNALGLEENNE